MRIRTIKPEFFLHEELAELDAETRLAFIGLWCAADREGRFEWRPKKLKAQILPYSDTDFSRVLDALATRGLLVRYASETREFGWIPGFTRHQVINNRERESEIPPVPESASTNDSDATGTREGRVDHATRSCTSGREGKGTGNKEGSTYQTFLGGRLIANFPVSDELLGLLAKAEGADAAAFQESLESALKDGGWKVEREVKVDDRGDGRPGRVDLEARAAHTSVGIECDFRSAREKSITKLSRNYELWAVICREPAGLLPDVAADGSDLGELRERVCRMFGHSGALPKDRKVNGAWNDLVGRCAISEADVELLEWWYGNKKNPPPRLKGRYWTRTSVLTLLRNWERDLAFVRNVCEEFGGADEVEREEEDGEEDDIQAKLYGGAY